MKKLNYVDCKWLLRKVKKAFGMKSSCSLKNYRGKYVQTGVTVCYTFVSLSTTSYSKQFVPLFCSNEWTYIHKPKTDEVGGKPDIKVAKLKVKPPQFHTPKVTRTYIVLNLAKPKRTGANLLKPKLTRSQSEPACVV